MQAVDGVCTAALDVDGLFRLDRHPARIGGGDAVFVSAGDVDRLSVDADGAGGVGGNAVAPSEDEVARVNGDRALAFCMNGPRARDRQLLGCLDRD